MLSFRRRPICRHVLGEISNHIARDLHGRGGPRVAGCKLREYACGMIHKIRVKARGSDLLLVQIARQLVNQRTHHFQVAQFVRPIRLSTEAAPAGAGTASLSLLVRGEGEGNTGVQHQLKAVLSAAIPDTALLGVDDLIENVL